MKKVIHLLSAAILASALAACSQHAPKTVEPETKTVSVTEEQAQEHDLQSTAWSYEGATGPESWGELDEQYAACVNGSEQSPINIELSEAETNKTIEEVNIQYEPTTFSVINNGHTIQANTASVTNKIILDETEYQLVQFHFHTPSEHQFNGQPYEMELHLVHQNESGELAVLGVMIQEGSMNEYLQPVWAALQEEITEEDISLSEPVQLQTLLPKDQTFLHYNGSLTTPPCTEEVEWIILEQPIELSQEQIQVFQQIFPDNHRPIQPLNEREVIRN
ncbi:carbonic anhydrase family protein [Lysinibacillus fusiformis]|nr:carbonic anhydrase family protein [Lysinibacillus fusiformis]